MFSLRGLYINEEDIDTYWDFFCSDDNQLRKLIICLTADFLTEEIIDEIEQKISKIVDIFVRISIQSKHKLFRLEFLRHYSCIDDRKDIPENLFIYNGSGSYKYRY